MIHLLVFILFTHTVSSTLSVEELEAICDINTDNNIGISSCPNATTISICGIRNQIKCDDSETTILYLLFPRNYYSGTLSANIGKLKNLTYIDFEENYFEDLPDSLFGLSNLTFLSLTSNKLQGTIPALIGQLSALKSLKLGKNNFEAIPTQIGNLSDLTFLYLYANDISTIPTQLFSLSKLIYLNLGYNPFNGSSIPTQIGDLSALEILDLTGGHGKIGFSGSIPATIGNMTSLKELILINNKLNGTLPTQLNRLRNLTKLDLSSNLELNVDTLFSFDFPVIEELYLSLVNMSSVPSTINKFQQLKKLSLGGMRLQTIPKELAELPLTNLDLSGNQLSNIEHLMNLTLLSNLNLDGNKLEGSVPSQLANLKNLIYLNLKNNNFVGTIPSQLGTLENLTDLIIDPDYLICPSVNFQPNKAFQKICDTTIDGSVFIPNVAMIQGASLIGKNMEMSTQSLEISLDATVRLINSTISVSGNTTISSLNLILENENRNQPAISTTGCLNIQPDTVLNVTANGMSQTNQTLFSFACKTGNFSRVQVNGKTACNFVITNNFAMLTRTDCSGSGEGKTTNIFFFFVLLFIFVL